MFKDLYKRMEGLEKTLTDHNVPFASNLGSSATLENSMDMSAMSPEAMADYDSLLPNSNTPNRSKDDPLIEDRALMLDIFFQDVANNLFSFLHEETVRQSVMEKNVSLAFIYALYAISCWYVKPCLSAPSLTT